MLHQPYIYHILLKERRKIFAKKSTQTHGYECLAVREFKNRLQERMVIERARLFYFKFTLHTISIITFICTQKKIYIYGYINGSRVNKKIYTCILEVNFHLYLKNMDVNTRFTFIRILLCIMRATIRIYVRKRHIYVFTCVCVCEREYDCGRHLFVAHTHSCCHG